ncbi:PREDICTED: superoxide dismutase [Cu-Zn] 2-like [Papilio xuthus]|uniref:superoxide dismutase n=1 Tax=Papilio xuthus TaxID=66420 RepID=A0A194Q3L2_PAPXU|nr:PREDICTED: superoxide dismutase [Cu-Zn] 2-like [Papilio xuthus]KPJ00128.1 Superoxide dismutase [Cu-Zn], chloroplastic [Papilio xuthus]
MKCLLMIACVVVAVAAHGGHDHSHSHDHSEKSDQERAIVKLEEPNGGKVHGNVTFVQEADGKVHVQGVIVGMSAGEYGFHIYEKGDITGGCGSNGEHFNPDNKDHGHPHDEERHAGDLGNVVFNKEQVAHVDFFDHVIKLSGPYSIVGRAIVLHSMADDYGKTEHPDSKRTGNAGHHVACGVIGYW